MLQSYFITDGSLFTIRFRETIGSPCHIGRLTVQSGLTNGKKPGYHDPVFPEFQSQSTLLRKERPIWIRRIFGTPSFNPRSRMRSDSTPLKSLSPKSSPRGLREPRFSGVKIIQFLSIFLRKPLILLRREPVIGKMPKTSQIIPATSLKNFKKTSLPLFGNLGFAANT
jgi:hypothetical protein